ncbi:MBL fold metallo-hydrolase [Streptomyces chiangmaiensis]|uniref:MBL fold metallo-hydrolase n=1 Tax=Streptomyces chiangmaiensis TaxID=766497 RepID=A0ABU7FTX4_9ACTN|nr:MBL fold metallo-hydrolase [Streptomyces chiangmaiensis]MED7827517.1 MBL fold metallo-hydrolase [Streptomyces chiangmaiensis]
MPTEIADVPPDLPLRMWSPVTAKLITGERNAVLIDALMTVSRLADWVAANGKSLTTVFLTHGHGDHWFGLDTLLERFPHVRGHPADRAGHRDIPGLGHDRTTSPSSAKSSVISADSPENTTDTRELTSSMPLADRDTPSPPTTEQSPR